MRDILDVFKMERGGKGKRQRLPGSASRQGHAIRRNELMGIRQQLERQPVMFDRW